jgi:hypothetical protein
LTAVTNSSFMPGPSLRFAQFLGAADHRLLTKDNHPPIGAELLCIATREYLEGLGGILLEVDRPPRSGR